MIHPGWSPRDRSGSPQGRRWRTVAASTVPRPSPLKALGLLLGAVLLVAGYLVLCSAIGNSDFYAGFLFLLCWAALEQGKLAKLPHAALGAAFGLALGYALHVLTTGPLGATGGYIFAALLLPVIYCQLMGWLSLVVNFTAMAFLTVVTIPYVQAHGDFRNAALALIIGVVYFSFVLGVSERLSARPKGAIAGS
jgi:hypothetical protein